MSTDAFHHPSAGALRFPLTCSSFLASVLIASSASAVAMDWTFVGDPNNACDTRLGGSCNGAVGYSYRIGTYEVTNAQYTEFLNAKAASDPLGLYNGEMGASRGGITRSGNPESYSYSTVVGREDVPVSFVSFYDALRFANWMNNGQGSADTENGAYTLLGGTPTPTNGNEITRNAGATIALTSEDEWHKAAYYDPLSASYFEYPAQSNTQTTCAAPTGALNSANCNSAVGDFTAKGSYTNSASPYGTFDQGGNAWEWNETLFVFYPPDPPGDASYARGLGGGNIFLQASYLGAWGRYANNPAGEDYHAGIRLVFVPEPSTSSGLIVGIAGLLAFGRRRARP